MKYYVSKGNKKGKGGMKSFLTAISEFRFAGNYKNTFNKHRSAI